MRQEETTLYDFQAKSIVFLEETGRLSEADQLEFVQWFHEILGVFANRLRVKAQGRNKNVS